MKQAHPNEKVRFVIFPDTRGKNYGATESRKIQRAIKDTLLLKNPEPYHQVQVKVRNGPEGQPEALIAYMLRAHTYTADVARLNVDAEYKVQSVESPYTETE